MSDAQHTPGPWEFGSGDNYYVRADAYPKNFPHRFESDDLGDYLAYVGNRTHDFGKANARLIAAAPELLEALRAVISVADRKTVEFDLARAALAKAEGRSMPHPNQTEPK